jgi:hypothetical protein
MSTATQTRIQLLRQCLSDYRLTYTFMCSVPQYASHNTESNYITGYGAIIVANTLIELLELWICKNGLSVYGKR